MYRIKIFKLAFILSALAVTLNVQAANVMRDTLEKEYWEDGVVFYKLDGNVTSHSGWSSAVRTAISNWNTQAGQYLEFVDMDSKESGEVDGVEHILFERVSSANYCGKFDPTGDVSVTDTVDRMISKLNFRLYENVTYFNVNDSKNYSAKLRGKLLLSDGCSSDSNRRISTIMHEIGHALGLMHEHQRIDRAYYLDVTWYEKPQHIDPSLSDSEKLTLVDKFLNYSDRLEDLVNPVGPFDFNSIMIYESNSDISRKSTAPSTFGDPRQTTLSAGDLAAIKLIYSVRMTIESPDDKCLQLVHYRGNNIFNRLYAPAWQSPFQVALDNSFSDPDGIFYAEDDIEFVQCEYGNQNQHWMNIDGMYVHASGLCLAAHRYESGYVASEPRAKVCRDTSEFKWTEKLRNNRLFSRRLANDVNGKCLKANNDYVSLTSCYTSTAGTDSQSWTPWLYIP